MVVKKLLLLLGVAALLGGAWFAVKRLGSGAC